MLKLEHEVRDGIHGFILFDRLEKALIDSKPMQRLRCINQLAMSYQVYPGATHKRFEHSLGVMELATRIFDQLFRKRISDEIQKRIGLELDDAHRAYWRHVVRLAALLHDIGHLPFSHAAENDLLPEGWNHERITAEMIRHSEIVGILCDEPIKPEDVVDIAWDQKDRLKVDQVELPPWKSLLNEIISGRTFGADRIDYLLRDSWHAGVAYGRFDPDRLISGLTVVIDPTDNEIAIGLDIGAIHAAEALLLARYFMFTQVYCHDVRRVYDLHLKEFLIAWLEGGRFSSDWRELMKITDHEVLVAVRTALTDPNHELHLLANRLLARQHFHTIYELIRGHKKKRPNILDDLVGATKEEFGEENIRSDHYGPKSENNDFCVCVTGSGIDSSLLESTVIANIPPIEVGIIFAERSISERAEEWVSAKLRSMLDAG